MAVAIRINWRCLFCNCYFTHNPNNSMFECLKCLKFINALGQHKHRARQRSMFLHTLRLFCFSLSQPGAPEITNSVTDLIKDVVLIQVSDVMIFCIPITQQLVWIRCWRSEALPSLKWSDTEQSQISFKTCLLVRRDGSLITCQTSSGRVKAGCKMELNTLLYLFQTRRKCGRFIASYFLQKKNAM